MTQPYTSDWEYLCDEFQRLDHVIFRHILRQHRSAKNGSGDKELDQLRELVPPEYLYIISDLKQNLGKHPDPARQDSSGARGLTKSNNVLGLQISERLQATFASGRPLALPTLVNVLELDDFERFCLVTGMAPQVHSKFSRLFAYVQRDAFRWPTVETALRLFCEKESDQLERRAAFSLHENLRRLRLVELSHAGEPAVALVQRSFSVDDRLADFLLGISRPGIDARLGDAVELDDSGDTKFAPLDLARRIATLTSRAHSNELRDRSLLIQLTGPRGAGKRALARTAALANNVPLLVADAARLLTRAASPTEAVWLLAREAFLQPAVLYITNIEQALNGDSGQIQIAEEFLSAIETYGSVTVIGAEEEWRLLRPLTNTTYIQLPVPVPDLQQRSKIWMAHPQFVGIASDLDAGELAGKFRFTPGQIDAALQRAQDIATWRSPDDPQITGDDISQACRAESSQQLANLARKITPRYRLDDIVLPETQRSQLQEICGHVTHRHTVFGKWGFGDKLSLGKGLAALFAGPPGTGKTMAAEIIATELQLDLYRIDLSQVVSKYIGETEKNLQRIFDEAETSNAILFFDEADALFGKRSEVKDAHDRYANIEIAYLLQQMEEYEGASILATNLRQNLDDAFVRRLQFIVDFPFPTAEHRREIWLKTLPEDTPHGEIDYEQLARRFSLSGGNIKNVLVSAAFLAASNGGRVEMQHLLAATKREYTKLGRASRDFEFEALPLNQCTRS